MPKKCIKFIPEYLIPSLDNKRFGERLKWIDKTKNVFEIDWRHKAGPQWTEEEAQVFVEWDKHKGHFNPENKLYYSQSKQRFRALLYKLTKEGQLRELPSETKFKKVFCFGHKKNGRKKKDMNAEYKSSNEEEQDYEDPDSMISICRNISENEAVNVLEDHSYSVCDNFPGYLNLFKQEILNNFQDILVSTSSSESSSDNFHKRVLVERNCENISTLMPATILSPYAEGYSSFVIRDEPENCSLPLPAENLLKDCYLPVNQNSTISGNMFADTVCSLQPNMEIFDPWPNTLSEL